MNGVWRVMQAAEVAGAGDAGACAVSHDAADSTRRVHQGVEGGTGEASAGT